MIVRLLLFMMLVGLSVAFGCKGKDEPVKSHELTHQAANEIMVGANKGRLRIEQKQIDA